MADIEYTNLIHGNVSELPIQGFSLNSASDTYFQILFSNLEKETSFTIDPKTKADSHGNLRTLGYVIEASLYVPYNDYANNGLIHNLNGFQGAGSGVPVYYHDTTLIIYFGHWNINPHGEINTSKTKRFSVTLTNPLINYQIEQVELRPRLIIKTTYFTKNIESLIS